MLYILLLKLLGVCIDRKKSGAGFRKIELHNLVGGPFHLHQVRLFRVAGHAANIFVTSFFAAVFFAFHVESFFASVVGSYCAMMFTYLIYTNIAVVAAAMSEKTYRRCRTIGCTLAAGMFIWLLFRVSMRGVSNFAFLTAFGEEAIAFCSLPIVSFLMFPFFAFTQIIVSADLWDGVVWTVVGLFLNYVALQTLLYVETALEQRKEQRERTYFLANQNDLVAPNQFVGGDLTGYFGKVTWFFGAGPIIWRQLKGFCD